MHINLVNCGVTGNTPSLKMRETGRSSRSGWQFVFASHSRVRVEVASGFVFVSIGLQCGRSTGKPAYQVWGLVFAFN